MKGSQRRRRVQNRLELLRSLGFWQYVVKANQRSSRSRFCVSEEISFCVAFGRARSRCFARQVRQYCRSLHWWHHSGALLRDIALLSLSKGPWAECRSEPSRITTVDGRRMKASYMSVGDIKMTCCSKRSTLSQKFAWLGVVL